VSKKEREIYKDLDVSNWKIYKGTELSNEAYHAEKEHSSSSNLKDLTSKKKGRYDKDLWGIEKYYQEKILGEKGEQKKSNAFDEGSLAHCLILEPHNLDVDFAIYPEFRKAGNNFKTFKAAEEAGLNRTIVSKSQFKKVQSWVDAHYANKTAVNLMKGCEFEYSLFGEINGIKIKVRADAINIEEGYIVDVKTTSYDTDRESFAETVNGFQYELSGALYTQLFSMYYGKKFDFYFDVLGKKDKSCEVYRLGEDSTRKGNKKVRDALSVYSKCSESGIWVNSKPAESKKLEVKNYEILDV